MGGDAHLLGDLVGRVHRAEMLQRAHDRCAARFEIAVQRTGDCLRIGNQRRGERRVLDGHHDAVGETQAFQARNRCGRRQAELDHFVAVGGLDFAREPLRARLETAALEHLAEARQPRQRVLVARLDEVARALRTADQALLDEQRNRLARGDARHAERFGQHTLGRQRFAGRPAVVVDRIAELAGELQVERRIVVGVGAQVLPAVVRGCLHTMGIDQVAAILSHHAAPL